MKKSLIFVSIPWELLINKYLSLIIQNRVNLEIALSAEVLENYSYLQIKKIAQILKQENIKVTIHLPFMDLSLGALDSWIKEASLRRTLWSIEIASLFEPLNLVLHSGYHMDYHREVKEKWRGNFIESLDKIINFAEDLKVCISLENVFEPTPEFIEPIFKNFTDKLFWCFDPAHAKVFSETDELLWLNRLYLYIKEIHCHDTFGEYDNHLAIGKGIVKFKEIFDFLQKREIYPFLVSEAHNEEDTYKNMEILTKVF